MIIDHNATQRTSRANAHFIFLYTTLPDTAQAWWLGIYKQQDGAEAGVFEGICRRLGRMGWNSMLQVAIQTYNILCRSESGIWPPGLCSSCIHHTWHLANLRRERWIWGRQPAPLALASRDDVAAARLHICVPLPLGQSELRKLPLRFTALEEAYLYEASLVLLLRSLV